MMTYLKIFVTGISVAVLLSSCGGGQNNNTAANDTLHAKISISGAFSLYPLAVKLTEEYTKLNPGVTFDVQAGGAGKGMTDALTGTVDIGMVSREISPAEISKGAMPVAIAKDAVIPTMNAGNPYINAIKQKGVNKDQFIKMWMKASMHSWGDLLGNGAQEKIQVFTRSDAGGAADTWAKFLGGKQEDLQGVGVFGDPGVAESVAKDKFSVGYNNVNYLYDISTKKPFPGLHALPIDLNNNGTLEPEENFYENLDDLNKAIVEGRYPSPPAREGFFVIKKGSTNAALKKFLQWILTDGQQHIAATGYVQLPAEELQSNLSQLQ